MPSRYDETVPEASRRTDALDEAGWLHAVDPEPLLRHLNPSVSERKFRLTESAFTRRFWHLLTDQRSRTAVEMAEQFADGFSDRDELRLACAGAEVAYEQILDRYFPTRTPERSFWGGAVSAAQHAACSFFDAPGVRRQPENPERYWSFASLIWLGTAAYPIGEDDIGSKGHDLIEAEQVEQVRLLHDLFGNPFQPVAVNESWLTWNGGVIRRLAKTIYDERQFDRLPDLADVLVLAGCANADVLDHCRHPGPHVLGCWVLDLLLGKR